MHTDGLRLDPDTGIWQVDVSVEGRRRQLSSKTKNLAEARRFRDKVRAELWASTKLGRPQQGRTWTEATTLYLERARRKGNRALRDVMLQLQWLEPHLGGGLLRITDDLVAEALEAKRREGVQRLVRGEWRRLRDVSPATLNRYYSTIHSVLACAHARGWIDRIPHWERGSESARVEYLTVPQWRALRAELPEHIRPMAEFALLTGMRKAVVAGLRWEWITDSAILVPASVMKAKKAHRIDLTADLLSLLESQRGNHREWVFTYDGQQCKDPAGMAWQRALARAGLPEKFRWHSLRSTFVVWHLEAGTPMEVVMRWGGWNRIEVLLKHYAHFTTAISARHAGAITNAVMARDESVKETQSVSSQSQVIDLGWRMGLEPTTTGITIGDEGGKSS